MNELKKTMATFFENLENSLGHGLDEDSLLKSFEMFNFNDDYVIYCCVYVLAAICLFIVCSLTNFYRVRPREVVCVSVKSDVTDSKGD